MNTAYFYVLTAMWGADGGTCIKTTFGTVTLNAPTTRVDVLKAVRQDAEDTEGWPYNAPVLYFSIEPAEIGGPR